VKLAEVPKEQLPESKRRMNAEEQRAHLAQKSRDRARIQAEIQKLRVERNQFLSREFNEDNAVATLDDAIIGAVREQGRRKNPAWE